MAENLTNHSVNYDNSTSDILRQEINRYVSQLNFILTFVQAFILCAGLLGNTLTLIIINQRSLRKTSSSVFITFMAIFDSAVLLCHAGNLVRPRRNVLIHCSLTYLTDFFTFCANWILVIITLERCVAVSSPFLAKRMCTIKSARFYVILLLTTAVTFFSSTFHIFYVWHDQHRKKCILREKYALFHRIYQFILLYGLPDILLLSNIYTLWILLRRQHQSNPVNSSLELRVNDPQSNKKQRQLTIMLVTVSLAFYCFSTPAIIMFIREHFSPKKATAHQLKRNAFFSQVSVPLLQLQNATNFIFYSLAGQRFREVTGETLSSYWWSFKAFFHKWILRDNNFKKRQAYLVRRSRSSTKSIRQHSVLLQDISVAPKINKRYS